jgi:predicted PurR-regulated permease PerM
MQPRTRSPDATATRSMALRILATVGVGAVMYFARPAIAPVVLAVLFSLLLTSPVEMLHLRRVPRSVAALLVMTVLVSAIGAAANLLWTPAQNWWAAAPETLRTIEDKSRPIAEFLNRFELLTAGLDEISQSPAGRAASARTGRFVPPVAQRSAKPPVAAPNANPWADPTPRAEIAVLLSSTRDAAISIVAVGLMTFFLLAGGPPMLARISAALSGHVQATHMLKLIEAVRNELSRYYASIALINLGLGVATTGITALLGMPNPLLWGAVAAVLNFIPYIGSAVTLVLLTIVAFVTFDGIGHVAVVTLSYLAVATIEGQLVQPLVVGHRLELHPIIVFLALWFGGWLWGIAGVVIAVPGLVSLKVVAQHSIHSKPLTELLSPEGEGPAGEGAATLPPDAKTVRPALVQRTQ